MLFIGIQSTQTRWYVGVLLTGVQVIETSYRDTNMEASIPLKITSQFGTAVMCGIGCGSQCCTGFHVSIPIHVTCFYSLYTSEQYPYMPCLVCVLCIPVNSIPTSLLSFCPSSELVSLNFFTCNGSYHFVKKALLEICNLC